MRRVALLTTLALTAPPGTAEGLSQRFPLLPGLEQGREVWLGTCKDCHASSLSDAPQVQDPSAWEPRLAQGRPVLLGHALGGFSGPAGSEMPPRGGNPGLSDAEVGAALDYMIRLVTR